MKKFGLSDVRNNNLKYLKQYYELHCLIHVVCETHWWGLLVSDSYFV